MIQSESIGIDKGWFKIVKAGIHGENIVNGSKHIDKRFEDSNNEKFKERSKSSNNDGLIGERCSQETKDNIGKDLVKSKSGVLGIQKATHQISNSMLNNLESEAGNFKESNNKNLIGSERSSIVQTKRDTQRIFKKDKDISREENKQQGNDIQNNNTQRGNNKFSGQLYESEIINNNINNSSRNKSIELLTNRETLRNYNKDVSFTRINFQKKSTPSTVHEESYDCKNNSTTVLGNIMTQQSRLAQSTVEKVLQHGQENTKMLKEAFKDFVDGFKNLEKSGFDKGSQKVKNRKKELKKELAKERQRREKMEEILINLISEKQQKSENSKDRTLENSQFWEEKAKRAVEALSQANQKARVLEETTEELSKEIHKFKNNFKNNNIEEDWDLPTRPKNRESLPTYIYIKGRTEERTNSGSFESSRRNFKMKTRDFLEEFERNPRFVNLGRKFARDGENKLYRLRDNNIYEAVNDDRNWKIRRSYSRPRKRFAGGDRFSKSLISEWVPEDRRRSRQRNSLEHSMDYKKKRPVSSEFFKCDEPYQYRKQNYRRERERERGDEQRDYMNRDIKKIYQNESTKDIKNEGVNQSTQTSLKGAFIYDQEWVESLERNHQRQEDMFNKLFDKQERETQRLWKSNATLNNELASKNLMIKDFKLTISELEKKVNSCSDRERNRITSCGSWNSQKIGDALVRFDTFSKTDNAPIYESGKEKMAESSNRDNRSQQSRKDSSVEIINENNNQDMNNQFRQEEVVTTKVKQYKHIQNADINSDLLKFLYCQAMVIDETINFDVPDEESIEEEDSVNRRRSSQYENVREDYYKLEEQFHLEPINELTDDKVSSFKNDPEEEDNCSISYPNNNENLSPNEENTQFMSEKKAPNSKNNQNEIRRRNYSEQQELSQYKGQINKETRISNYNLSAKSKERNENVNLEEKESIKQEQVIEEKKPFDEYISENGGRYFVNGNLIFKVDPQGRVVGQKVMSDSLKDNAEIQEQNKIDNEINSQPNLVFGKKKRLSLLITKQYDDEFFKANSQMSAEEEETEYNTKITKESLNGKNFSDNEEESHSVHSGKVNFKDY